MRNPLAIRLCCKLVVLTLFLLPLAGCWDKKELEEEGFVTTIGLDQGEGDQFLYTFQIMNPLHHVGPIEQSGAGTPDTKSVTVQADGIVAAANLANTSISKELNLTQTHVLLISEEVARTQNMIHVLMETSRYRQFRSDISVFITRENTNTFIKNLNPVLESYVYKYYDLNEIASKHTGLITVLRLSDMLTQMQSFSDEAVVPLASTHYTDLKKTKTRPHKESKYRAGDLPRQSQGDESFLGGAVFRRGRLVGDLTGQEVRSFNLIKGTYKEMSISVPDPIKKNRSILLKLMPTYRPTINVQADPIPKVTIEVELNVSLLGIQSAIDYVTDPKLKNQLASATQKVVAARITKVIDKLQHQYNSDGLGIGNIVRHKFLTWDDWVAYNWYVRYKTADIQVHVSLHFVDFGYQTQPIFGGGK